MANLIRNEDLRSLFLGAAGVAAVGLVGGALMHPSLALGGDWPQGPQMAVGYGAERSEYVGSATMTSYSGRTPDYVIGTDWLKAQQPQPPQADAVDARIDAMAREDARDQAPVMAYAAEDHGRDAVEARANPETALAVSYPSTDGGRAYEADLPRPPPLPADES